MKKILYKTYFFHFKKEMDLSDIILISFLMIREHWKALKRKITNVFDCQILINLMNQNNRKMLKKILIRNLITIGYINY